MRVLNEIFTLLSVLIVIGPAYAQSERVKISRFFGQEYPRSLQKLPTSKLPTRLENLPPYDDNIGSKGSDASSNVTTTAH